MSSNDGRICVVTGASGFTGGHCVEELLRHGFTVRATVRDPTNKASTEFLKSIAEKHNAAHRLSFFGADLSRRGSFDAAFTGAEAVLHVAAVTEVSFKKDPLTEIVCPGVDGAKEVALAAKRCGVKRIVLTASGSLVDQFDPDRLPQYRGKPFVEEEQRFDLRPTRCPYVLEKVLSEQVIGEIFDCGPVISLLPTLIIGPQQNGTVRSSQNLFQVLLTRASAPYSPRFYASWIDVRDVARAHRLALDIPFPFAQQPKANLRRYIISSTEVISCATLAQSINKQFPGTSAPETPLPHWVAGLASWFDERLTDYLRLDLSEPRAGMDLTRTEKEFFKREFTDLDQTVRDAVTSFKQHKII